MPENGICRDHSFKNFLVRRGHSPPRAPPLGINEPSAESLTKAVENTAWDVNMCTSYLNWAIFILGGNPLPPPKKNFSTHTYIGVPYSACSTH